jgi:hypothetical protein
VWLVVVVVVMVLVLMMAWDQRVRRPLLHHLGEHVFV